MIIASSHRANVSRKTKPKQDQMTVMKYTNCSRHLSLVSISLEVFVNCIQLSFDKQLTLQETKQACLAQINKHFNGAIHSQTYTHTYTHAHTQTHTTKEHETTNAFNGCYGSRKKMTGERPPPIMSSVFICDCMFYTTKSYAGIYGMQFCQILSFCTSMLS